MTDSRKGKTPERVRRNSTAISKLAGKRKLGDLEADSPTRSRSRRQEQQRQSGVKLFSSPASASTSSQRTILDDNDAESDEIVRNGRRGITGRRHLSRFNKRNQKAEGGESSFAEMYNFTSSKAKTNGVIDLTETGSSPKPCEAHKRKPSFASSRPTNTFNPHQGPKKLVVKNLRTTPRIDPQQYFEKVWVQEDSALDAIFRSEKEPYSLEELYRGAENVCRQGKAADLYVRLKEKCQVHLSGTVRKRIADLAKAASDVEVLKAFVDAWSTWQKQLLTIRQIFYFMDQAYLLRSQEHPSVTETGLILFRSQVFRDANLSEKVMNGIIALFDAERKVQIHEDESNLLRQSINTLHELSIYSSDFEPVFKTSTEKYFRSWRETDAGKENLAHYSTACTNLLEKEMTRADLLALDRVTRAQILELFDTVFVKEDIDTLIQEDSVINLLEANLYQELEYTFKLLQRDGRGDRLGPPFNKYIESEGSSIVFDEKREADMVISLLDFKRRLDHFLQFSFHNNEPISNGFHKSFETFINKTKRTQANWDTDNAKPGEMIAKHVDLLLKGGVKAIPKLTSTVKPPDPSKPAEEEHDFDDAPPAADEDAEINQHLSNALDLFRFVHGKAVFEAFYKKDLARRLLMGRSASFDAERNMLTRLKNECGASFTQNLESMFKDMNLAREEMMSYNQLLEDRGRKRSSDEPDLSVNVLSSAAWPSYPDVPVTIPPQISKITTAFESHYKTKHSGRKLTWKHALAHCQLRARFAKGVTKELVVSGFQAIVLLLFNDLSSPSQSLSYSDLKSSTGLSDPELKRTLQSLACAKYRVLLKTPRGRDVNVSDSFAFNAGFTDPKMRIKINQIQLKETKEENKETHRRVAADRHYETQAAIVRIMKSRKTIGHNDLIVEVIKATRSRGVLDQADIKKNIEKLIEKDYMERDEGNTYSYVA